MMRLLARCSMARLSPDPCENRTGIPAVYRAPCAAVCTENWIRT